MPPEHQRESVATDPLSTEPRRGPLGVQVVFSSPSGEKKNHRSFMTLKSLIHLDLWPQERMNTFRNWWRNVWTEEKEQEWVEKEHPLKVEGREGWTSERWLSWGPISTLWRYTMLSKDLSTDTDAKTSVCRCYRTSLGRTTAPNLSGGRGFTGSGNVTRLQRSSSSSSETNQTSRPSLIF